MLWQEAVLVPGRTTPGRMGKPGLWFSLRSTFLEPAGAALAGWLPGWLGGMVWALQKWHSVDSYTRGKSLVPMGGMLWETRWRVSQMRPFQNQPIGTRALLSGH